METAPSELARPYKRILAFLVDLGVIYAYMIALFGSSMALNSVLPFHHLMAESYVFRHSISFLSLSFPVLMYFVLMESGPRGATLGKRALKLKVASIRPTPASNQDIVVRNVLKFLPWEWAHTFIHLNPQFFVTGQVSTPSLIIGYVTPMVAILVYLAFIFVTKTHRAPYELLSKTRVLDFAPNKKASTTSLKNRVLVGLTLLLGLSSIPVLAQSSHTNRPNASFASFQFGSPLG